MLSIPPVVERQTNQGLRRAFIKRFHKAFKVLINYSRGTSSIRRTSAQVMDGKYVLMSWRPSFLQLLLPSSLSLSLTSSLELHNKSASLHILPSHSSPVAFPPLTCLINCQLGPFVLRYFTEEWILKFHQKCHNPERKSCWVWLVSQRMTGTHSPNAERNW